MEDPTLIPLERRLRIDVLFEAALDLGPEARAAFLDRECAGDPELRATVARLLERSQEAADFLEPGWVAARPELADELAAGADAAQGDPLVGRRVGPYRVLRVLGRGGSGTVYHAERVDGHFRQQVALKVLRRGLDTEDVLARFRTERQILASLVHPNIARLLDGGATDDGRPYLVMERVDGIPITDYCRERELPLSDRLRLFCTAGRAVQHAHRSLVVHRDIKPSNILVTADGTVKLLDFGIAKLLTGALDGEEDIHTRAGLRLMTPRYATPEQIRGEPVTTATDVYQLGLLLYELITGLPACPASPRSLAEAERLVCEKDPVPPSQALTGATPAPAAALDPELKARRRARRRLRGDVDTLVLKALDKDPDRRYASALGLVEDVERFLDGRPLLARPGRWHHRLWKLVRRRPTAVAAGAAVAALFIVWLTTLMVQSGRLEAERDRARAEAERAEAVAGFLVDLFDWRDIQGERLDTLTAQALLQRGTSRLTAGAFAVDGPTRASLLHALGSAYAGLGFLDPAGELLAEAVDTRRRLHGDDDPAVARALLALGARHAEYRYHDAALAAYREAAQIARFTSPPDAGLLLRALNGMTIAHVAREEPDSAYLLINQARDLGADARIEPIERLAIEIRYGMTLRAMDRLDDAADVYHAALRELRTLGPSGRSLLAAGLNNLGYLLLLRDDFEAAEAVYREAMDVRAHLSAPDHPTSIQVLTNLVSSLARQDRYDEAEELMLWRLDLERGRFPDGHWRIGSAHEALGRLALARADSAAAADWFSRAAEIYEELLGPEHAWTARARSAVVR